MSVGLLMEISTAGFLLLQTLFALLQTLIYSCYSLLSLSKQGFASLCGSQNFHWSFFQSSILHHGNSASVGRKAVNYQNRLWIYICVSTIHHPALHISIITEVLLRDQGSLWIQCYSKIFSPYFHSAMTSSTSWEQKKCSQLSINY